MYKFIIRPYKLGSKGARLLAETMSRLLGYKVKRVNSTYIPRRNEKVINWGCNKDYYKVQDHDANHTPTPATNKLFTFQKFKENNVNHPEWTTNKEEAKVWVSEGHSVLCRKLLTGNSGAGIILVESVDIPLPNAPLYVKYKKKKKEFRVHVVYGKAIEVVEKRKRKGFDAVDTKIRNHGNGWVFCRDNVIEPNDLRTTAIAAVSAVGLDFGAVDIIWNEKENKCYALEVNTAPGIEGTTVQQYAEALIQL